MKRFNIMILVLMAVWIYGFVTLTARADIYSWTDENGVSHFTNYSPPKQAKLLIKAPEIPFDEEADNQRRENDRLEVARQELAEREAFLLQEQQAAERRLAEANARADAALREADQILKNAEAATEDANYNRSNGYGGGYGYRDGYGYYPYSRLVHEYRYRRHPGFYHKNYYPKYRHGRPYKYGYRHGNKTHFKSRPRNNGFKRHRGLSRGRGFSHRSRTAAFRGRHGRR